MPAAAGGPVGFPRHCGVKGSELGLHSTGVCLSFCLFAFYYYRVIFLDPEFFDTLEITNDLSVHLMFSVFRQGHVTYAQNAFSSCFPDRDGPRTSQVDGVLKKICCFYGLRWNNSSYHAAFVHLQDAVFTGCTNYPPWRHAVVTDSLRRGSVETDASMPENFSYASNG